MTRDTKDLTERIAFVSGSTQEIGRAIAAGMRVGGGCVDDIVS